MRVRSNGSWGKAVPLFFIFIFVAASQVFSQTKYLLPLGNSITQGKIDFNPPPAGQHGYRKPLYDLLHADYNVDFVGPLGDAPYYGYFYDGAYLNEYLPDSTRDVVPMLDALANKPDFITLHFGTNDVFSEQPVGNYYDELDDNTIMGDFNTLLKTLLDYTWTGPDSVEQIFLCKIIPASPSSEFPGYNAKVVDYNTKIQEWYDHLPTYRRNRITLVNMYTPFNANQYVYYNVDTNPISVDDHVHPNQTGYDAMASYFGDYIISYMNTPLVDEFNRAAGALNGTNNWTADAAVQIWNVGESGGGAIYATGLTTNWNEGAIWASTLGLNSVSITFHSNTTSYADSISGSAGILFGLNSTDPTLADGYMAFVNNGVLRIYVFDNGAYNNEVASATFPNYTPGAEFKVTYAGSTGSNIFYVSINGGSETVLYPTISLLTSGTDYYSGVVFHNATYLHRILIDQFTAGEELVDPYPPGRITDLDILSQTSTTITLQWTAPGDDDYETGRKAASYDLRYSTSNITAANFDNALIVGDVPAPDDAGSTEVYTVKGLLSGKRYYFAVKATDLYGNTGTLSNVPSDTTKREGMVSDPLTDLDDWVYDPTEYAIGGSYSEMVNLKTGDTWGTMAIYTGRTNPTIVQLKWGQGVIAPPAGIENGGLVVLANDSSITADGYLVFVRTQKDLIYLYDVVNGSISDQLDAVAWEPASYPGAGDTLTVVIDQSNDNYNKFDVYINGVPASRISLFDTRPEADRHGNGGDSYAGLFLSRLSPADRNAVTAFITSGERGLPAGISVAGGNNFEGTVNQWLQDSAAVCVVEVRDENNLPLSAMPVFFQVTAGNGQVSTPYTPDGHIRYEAEWGNPVAPLVELADATASNGKYIVSTGPSGDNTGYATYSLYIETAGTYYFWGRVKNVSYWSRFVLAFELEGQTPSGGFAWHCLSEYYPGGITGNWQWGRVNNEGSVYSVTLNPGQYTMKIISAHAGVQLDKLFITRNASYTPSGAEEIETAYTNSSGRASTAWRLGTVADNRVTPTVNEGYNEITARTFGTASTAKFFATGTPDASVTIQKVADNLTGASGDTVAVGVRLLDLYSNRTPGKLVQFTLAQGDGWLAATTDTATTNNAGEAYTRLVLGAEATVLKVRATFTGYTGPEILITVNATQGLARKLLSQTVPQTLYVNETKTNFLKAKVLGAGDVPLADIPVKFVVTSGSASIPGNATDYTNAQGIAEMTLVLGRTASVVTVEARTSGLTTVVFSDSVFYLGTRVTYLSGSGQLLTLNAESAGALRVVVFNSLNQPVSGQPVTFIVKNTASGFTFRNGGHVYVDTTDTDGMTKRTFVRSGSVHGTYADIIEATATNGFNVIPDSPIKFTFHVKSEAHHFVKVQGDSSAGVVRSIIGPIKAQMVKANGQAIGGQPVTLKRSLGDGSFDPVLTLTEKTLSCDASGVVSFYYWLGSTAGEWNNKVRVYSVNVSPDTLSTTFAFSAQSSAAAVVAVYPAGSSTTFTDTVGASKTVRVIIRDAQGNAVQGEEVTFTVISGGGTVGAGTADPMTIIPTNSSGVAQTVWTLGTQVGTLNNVLHATAGNGISPLSGSPVVFSATAGPDIVSLSRSTVEATTPVHAMPDSTCHITYTLLDGYGNPVQGKQVKVYVRGSQWDIWQEWTLPTDAAGKATSFLKSLTAGIKTIYGIVNGDTMASTAQVIFLANNATTIVKNDPNSGDSQTGNVGTVLQTPLSVLITDGFNPVPYGPVYFTVLGGKGTIIESMPVVSDSDGVAIAHLKLDASPGIHYVQVTSPGLSGSPTFSATGRAPSTISQIVYPYDDYDYILEGPAGQVLAQPFIVKVLDSDNLPVFGTPVTFSIDTPESDGSMVESQPVFTNEYGRAQSYYRMHTRADTLAWVKAQHTSILWPVWFKAVSQAGLPAVIEAVSPVQQTVFVNASLELKVKVTDYYGNVKEDVQITFEVASGTATIQQGLVTETDSTGVAKAIVAVGSAAGTNRIWAKGKALSGSPVEFIIEVQTSTQMADNIRKYPPPGDGVIPGTVGQVLADSLRAQVIDAYGNGVPGQPVIFKRTSGEGWLINDQGQMVLSQRVDNNAQGIASIQFKVGSTPGLSSQVTAEWTSTKKVTYSIQANINPHYPVLNKSLIYSSYTINEGQFPPLRILLDAEDEDGDPLNFTIATLFPPEGTSIQLQSDTSAFFQWSPGYDQSGTYDITLRVTDGRGGSDQKTTRIFVQNVNRLPQIAHTIPTRDTTFAAGKTILFWVDATDADGDYLNYSWKVNGQLMGGQTESVFYYAVNKYTIPGIQTVDAFVSDGQFYISHRWNLSITTSVEISEMAAQFMADIASVRLWWSTSRETDHLGFNVLRSRTEDGTYVQINDALITEPDEGRYSYIDRTVEAGCTYYYKIMDVDSQGNEREHGPIVVKVPLPGKFELSQNYPNPFNPVTTIRFQIPEKQQVKLVIYNMLGQKIATLLDAEKNPGYYHVTWDGRDEAGREVSSGIYIYRLGGKETRTGRMVKIR